MKHYAHFKVVRPWDGHSAVSLQILSDKPLSELDSGDLSQVAVARYLPDGDIDDPGLFELHRMLAPRNGVPVAKLSGLLWSGWGSEHSFEDYYVPFGLVTGQTRMFHAILVDHLGETLVTLQFSAQAEEVVWTSSLRASFLQRVRHSPWWARLISILFPGETAPPPPSPSVRFKRAE